MHLRVVHQRSQFWPILARFVDYYSPFWGPRAIYTIDDLRGAFMCRSSTIAVFVDSVPFVDYYSPFWGPKAISIVVEPQGVLSCWSSSLAVLADSGPFLGLLLTVLGSRSDFHNCLTPVLDYYSLFGGPE